VLPNKSEKTDWEAELGFIIGRTAKKVSREDALSYVAGYCVANDVSERGVQMATSQWVKGKSCDSFAPIGPWLVTPDEVKDLQDLHIWLKVNGKTMQDSNTGDMIFGVSELISHLSGIMTLQAGDIVITGTPSGVGNGMQPPVYLSAGDTVELGIDGLGSQRQTVISE
jgi:2-keto-4-pentenoate hydratase/2-oxohepta-3-ene-1,7-dioic acid hydratase in catechol pathway